MLQIEWSFFMKKLSSPKLHFALLLFLTLTCLSACGSKSIPEQTNLSSSVNLSNAPLQITVLETGKSDCIVIEIEDKTVMIDTGLDENGEKIVNFLNKNNIKTIDYLIISHLDQDHIGGLDKLLDNISVTEVIQPNYTRDTNPYQKYQEALAEEELIPVYLSNEMQIDINGASLTLYPPLKDKYELSNDYSIITSLTYGDHSFLFTGDAESIRLNEFLSTHPQHYTLLKLPHHGKNNDKLDELLTTISPTYGVITCSEEEYADLEVLELLAKHHVQTIMTSDGTVTIQSNGKNISVNQQLKTIISFKQKIGD